MTERDILAAESALGLLDSADAERAHALARSDPEFAAEVDGWEARFAPMLEDIAETVPDQAVWEGIEREVAAIKRDTDPSPSLRRVPVWQWPAGVAAAAALLLALFVAYPPSPVRTPRAPVLAGSIPIENTPLRLALTYRPERHELRVIAAEVARDGRHDHELWLIPPEGDPLSLGLVEPGGERSLTLDPAVARRIRAGAKLALTREPLGGKPIGQAAGPIVGSGILSEI